MLHPRAKSRQNSHCGTSGVRLLRPLLQMSLPPLTRGAALDEYRRTTRLCRPKLTRTGTRGVLLSQSAMSWRLTWSLTSFAHLGSLVYQAHGSREVSALGMWDCLDYDFLLFETAGL